MKLNNLSDLQLDVLREIGNIGAGNAATSMSELINEKVNMDIPSVNIVTFDDMMEIIGGPEKLIVAMYFRVEGEVPCTVYFILTVEKAESLVSQITNDTKLNLLGVEQPNEIAISALKEIGNIMTGAYLSALSDFMNVNMQPSIPHLGVDMAGAILTAGLLEVSQVSDYAIIIDTEINDSDGDNGLHGHFFLLPDLASLPKIFTALGITS